MMSDVVRRPHGKFLHFDNQLRSFCPSNVMSTSAFHVCVYVKMLPPRIFFFLLFITVPTVSFTFPRASTTITFSRRNKDDKCCRVVVHLGSNDIDDDRVDIAIVGAGIGGLCAGAILNTLYGKKVGVYESHYLPGGCAHAFDRRAPNNLTFTFDSGPTILLG